MVFPTFFHLSLNMAIRGSWSEPQSVPHLVCAVCIEFLHLWLQTSLVAQMVKHLPTMRETWLQSLCWEDLLEKEMATHSSMLAWKIPWMEEPGRLQSTGLQRVQTRLSDYHYHLWLQRIKPIWFQYWPWKRVFTITSAYSWQNLVSLCLLLFVLQGQIFLLLQVSLVFVLLHFSSL